MVIIKGLPVSIYIESCKIFLFKHHVAYRITFPAILSTLITLTHSTLPRRGYYTIMASLITIITVAI